jgi:hypothetical protein
LDGKIILVMGTGSRIDGEIAMLYSLTNLIQ